MMDADGNPREGVFRSLGLTVSCLLAVAHNVNQKIFVLGDFSVLIFECFIFTAWYSVENFLQCIIRT